MREEYWCAKANRRWGSASAALCIALTLLFNSGAQAQAPGASLATNYASNKDKPINIEADSLEVDDAKKIATFKGSVSATQGDFNLKADELLVTYSAGSSGGDKKEAGAAAEAGANIKRIDAKGNVVVTTQDNQEATSDWAIFDVEKQEITIGVNDNGSVVLAQGGNVLRGSRLVIDLATGRSNMTSTKRVQTLFTPKQRDDDKKDAGAN